MILKQDILSYISNKAVKGFDAYYLYDSNVIREHCKMFQNISYENKSIHFASMANVNHNFLQIVKSEGINIFVNSILHLQTALEAGFKNNEIILTASALSEKTMKYAGDLGIQINVDSQKQLEQWLRLFPNKSSGIRCNIGDKVKPYSSHAGFFIGKESRLGFTQNEIQQITDKTKINGLHLYVGTDIFDINYFTNCYTELIAIAADFPSLEYINFGGGFGVAENGENKFDISEYNIQVTKLMNEVSLQKNKNLKLILEPGRIIGGESGYFICEVTDVKGRESLNFVGVNASTAQFSRPLLYPDTANHPVMIIRDGQQLSSKIAKPTTIYGCSTYSRDIFSNKTHLPEIKIGDIIVFGNAGSYSASSHSQFLGFSKSEEFFI